MEPASSRARVQGEGAALIPPRNLGPGETSDREGSNSGLTPVATGYEVEGVNDKQMKGGYLPYSHLGSPLTGCGSNRHPSGGPRKRYPGFCHEGSPL